MLHYQCCLTWLLHNAVSSFCFLRSSFSWWWWCVQTSADYFWWQRLLIFTWRDRILNFLQRNSSTFQTSAALSFNRRSREETLMMCKHPRKRGGRLSGEAPRGERGQIQTSSSLCPAGCLSRSPGFRPLSVRLSPAHLLRPGIDLSLPPNPPATLAHVENFLENGPWRPLRYPPLTLQRKAGVSPRSRHLREMWGRSKWAWTLHSIPSLSSIKPATSHSWMDVHD